MADAASVPLWFSGLTFFGGLISSQLLEFWKDSRGAQRDKETRQVMRTTSQQDLRNQFQRDTLLELQQKSYEIMKSLSDIVLHHKLQLEHGLQRTPLPAADAYSLNTDALWRFGLLSTRVRDAEVGAVLAAFADLVATYNERFGIDDLDSFTYNLRRSYASLMKVIGKALREIDDSEIAGAA